MGNRWWCGCLIILGLTLVPVAAALASPEGGLYAPETGGPLPAAPAPVPGPGLETSLAGLILKVILTLGLICGLIYGLFWFIARQGKRHGAATGLVKLVETVPLGPNRFIGIIEVAQRYFVVGVTDHAITPISELEAPEIALLAQREEEIPAPGFAQFLGGKMRVWKRKSGE